MSSMENDLLKMEMDRMLAEAEAALEEAKALKLPKATWELMGRCLAKLAPPPNLTLSEWADEYRRLSPESGGEAGRWHTDKAPYQREIMDAISDPHIREVVLMTAAQIGKTAMLLNLLGMVMHYDPCPMMVLDPTVEMGQSFSKDFLTPMIRDTPVLTRLVDNKSKTSGNTILKKNFPGGHITIVGANSPVGLAMRPIKVLLADEVDRYPRSAGEEGDPLSLAKKRQTKFWDRKTVIVSTPTIKGDSRIEKAFLASTQEEWNVPCPECGVYQPLKWAGVKFDKEDLSKGIFYECQHCGCVHGEFEWKAQGSKGHFVAANPGAEARGFHLNTLASSFCGWKDVVVNFLAAKRAMDNGDYEEMKTWVNTELGETWEEPGVKVSEMDLVNRREVYDAQVPDGVLVLTAGVDVQDDRFEVEIKGWGIGKENWGIRYQKIYGDLLKDQVWEDLDAFLLTPWRKADGTVLTVQAVGMDTGGHYTTKVYRFCKERWDRHVYALKGRGGQDVPFISNPSTSNRVKVPLFTVGVDAGKALVFQRLRHSPKERRGPNYCHYPLNEEAGYDEEYFRGLTSEKAVTRYKKGRSVTVWEQTYKRNEPLDLTNYNTAAVEILNPVLEPPGEEAQRPRPKARGRRILSGGI